MVKAGRIDSLLRRHAVIDNIQNRLEDSGDDARTAWAAEHQSDLAVPLDQGWGH